MARLTRRDREVYRAGGFRFDAPAGDPDAGALVALESAIRILQSWTRRPRDIRAALAIPSTRSLARWRRCEEGVPWTTQERVALVFALAQRLSAAADVVTLEPLPALKQFGGPARSGRAVLAGGRLSELLALLLQLVLAEEAKTRRTRR